MISPAEWERMSWHARDKFLKRLRKEQGNAVNEPSAVQGQPVTVTVTSTFRDTRDDMTRCGMCGAWMMTECNTDHGRRYEP